MVTMGISFYDVTKCLSEHKLSGEEKRYLGDHIYRYIDTLHLISSIKAERWRVQRVLDVGAGFGHMASLLKFFYGCEVYAIDFQERFEGILRQRGIPFRCIDIEKEKFPFDEKFLDLVLFCEVIEHLNHNCVQDVLRETYRVLSEDGYLIITTPNRGLLSEIYRLLVKPKYSKKKILERGVHVQTHTLRELRRLLGKSGFGMMRAIYSRAWEASGLSRRDLPRPLSAVRRYLGHFPVLVESDLMVVCVKTPHLKETASARKKNGSTAGRKTRGQAVDMARRQSCDMGVKQLA